MVRRVLLTWLIAFGALLLAGCRQPDGALPAFPEPTATTIRLSLTLPAPLSPPQPITLAPGTTGLTLVEAIPAETSRSFELAAHAGQRLSVTAQSADAGGSNELALRLVSRDEGTVLQAGRAGVASWSGLLPDDGLYEITVANLGAEKRVTLTLSLPQRLNFVAGPLSATVDGVTFPEKASDYLVTARAGQAMTITVASPGGQVWLDLTAPDGKPLVPADAGRSAFGGTLLVSGEYAIRIGAPPSLTLPFTITLSITD